ncbi:bcl-2-related ovarian killer protein homolog B-like [Amphiura filiformis]|uniref:bcl-2-related ovarian killer protein homolog B-like n=1 Tax=Amphiura filiformis TaxID=82378 RepID=UPI003B218293
MAMLKDIFFSLGRPSKSQMEDQVVHQSKTLCRDFIFIKLKENGLVDRDIYDQTDPANVNSIPNVETEKRLGPTDVSKELITIAAVFENCYPNLFADVGNYLKVSYQTPVQIQSIFNSVASEIFHSSITWARIVSLFIFAAMLSVDCIKQGQIKFADVIVETMQKFIRKRLAHWIACRGGWQGLLDNFEQSRHPKWELWVVPSIGVIFGFVLAFIS